MWVDGRCGPYEVRIDGTTRQGMVKMSTGCWLVRDVGGREAMDMTDIVVTLQG